MALLNTYGAQNYVPQTALSVTYSFRLNFNDRYYEYIRYATKRYSFVGMTYAAALKCYKERQAMYTRKYGVVEMVNMTDSGGESRSTPANLPVYKTGAQVVMTHGEGDDWSVEVDVNETDTRMRFDTEMSPAEVFSDLNERNYDDTFAGDETAVTD